MRDDAAGEWRFESGRHALQSAQPRSDRGTATAAPQTDADVPELMWRHVGLFRDAVGLRQALARIDPVWQTWQARIAGGEPLTAPEWRAASIVTVGRLIARAALRREESRGGHYRTDFPQRDDVNWKRRVAENQVST